MRSLPHTAGSHEDSVRCALHDASGSETTSLWERERDGHSRSSGHGSLTPLSARALSACGCTVLFSLASRYTAWLARVPARAAHL